ncbi:MAG: DUF3108 domain-containing protein [Gammaproteobacteria bacterium]|nr:DUF3108 domain-containing protein [Gammaproteobacteria bacterium]MCP4091072.1 DUF3108 domain-containing protein [Gammaproteobacteria bacterium]MCP4277402.1 DUF3108 domain-containing protein [Gammaproteobacteria bacterium]MCP4831537.1 DUF3108 domain-containing protein [Gammaproteobacteria bacterium]MCP4927760.1 DUF3108 domain-containing protein [Gammaproteobacteria bacterium]
MFKLLLRSASVSIITLYFISANAAAPGQEIPGFHAEYKLKYSIFSGKVLLDLRSTDKPDEYIYSAHTNARGAARIVLSDTAKETSRFKYIEGEVQPIHYYLDNGMNNEDSETDIQFDLAAGVAHTQHEGQKVSYPINSSTLDRLSADIVAILALRAGQMPGTYEIADDNEIKTYNFELMGKEQIEVPAGKFKTLKFKRQRAGSSRSTLIWYAPEANYLAVRIEQQKRGKTKVTSVLTDYSLTPIGTN